MNFYDNIKCFAYNNKSISQVSFSEYPLFALSGKYHFCHERDFDKLGLYKKANDALHWVKENEMDFVLLAKEFGCPVLIRFYNNEDAMAFKLRWE